MAATTDADSKTKKIAFKRPGRSPIVRAWFSSKNVTIKSFHLASKTVRETKLISANCSVSWGVIAKILPIVITCTDTDIGLIETINNPNPKKAVKINPMITSAFKPDRSDKNSMAPAAKAPARKAPSANGKPRI